jgi:hypothetical protein
MATSIDITKYEIGEDAFDLLNLMQGVLDRIVTIYASYNVPLPVRKYWTMTQPAVDCEQLVVSFVQLYLGAPGDQAADPQRCNQPRSAVITISIARPVPTVGASGGSPAADKIQKSSEIVAIDAWILMQSVNLLDQWEEMGLYGPGVIATVDAGESSGGFQTATMQITMAVP